MSTKDENEAVKKAAQALAAGRLVAFPTETVYGLGADASNAAALSALFKLKGRPTSHPLIVHVASFEDVAKWATEVPEAAEILAQLFWPGPLTMVLKRAPSVLDLITGGQETVAIRVPSHPLALELINEFGGGIAAPSANRYGRLSPTSAEDVRNEFAGELEIVLDGGACQVGIESTIVDLSNGAPKILRPGMVKAESIYAALSELDFGAQPGDDSSPRVPGSTLSHYAPKTPVRVISEDKFEAEVEELERVGVDTAILSFKLPPMLHRKWITAKLFPDHYAHTLYRNLRKLDLLGAELIVVEEPPDDPDWDGIRDRLRRAAGPAGVDKAIEGDSDGA